ncbi:putative endonuclease [Paucibacter oligotrophus]|uniref:UPF0102 protein HNP55_003257 n=1 Tax=Roseateles oligotrophus TaxID=1769250 RepID=A0A840LDG0_9BURK|nr:YraN family protein [Roseateles oligotrophus]MBB4844713.1 putative endonuclease [Roseateles oligotrophus]
MLFKWRVSRASSKTFGEAAEEHALQFLQQHGLRLVERNYRVAAGPRARAGEVDLIMRDAEGTLVFVEVRARADASHGGAAASVGAAKQRRLIYAAQHFLLNQATPPPCRFDVIAIEGEQIEWLQAAFNAE